MCLVIELPLKMWDARKEAQAGQVSLSGTGQTGTKEKGDQKMSELNRVTHISFPDVSGYEDITNGIVSGSLSLDEVLYSGNFSFGEINSNKFEVQLYGISDVAGQKIKVWAIDNPGTSQEVITNLFEGQVDSCKLDNMGYYRSVVAYDKFYYLKTMDVSAFWNSFWASHTTSDLGTFREALLDYVGLSYEHVTLPNDSMVIAKTQDVDMISFTELFGKVCELNFCNPNINRDGEVEFIRFYENSQSTSLLDLYRGQESSFEDYTTKAVTQVRVYNSKKRVYGSYGSGSNVYVIQNNLFLYTKTETELASIAQALFTALNGFTYKPADIDMIISDLSYKVGDIVQTSKGYHLICENSLSGSVLVEQHLKATGDDSELTSIESLVDQETQNTIAQHTENIEDLLETQLIYLLPTNQDGSPITDGTSNTVLEWYFEAKAGAKIQVGVTLNPEIETTVITDTTGDDIYGDAVLTVVYKLDGDAIGTLTQVYGDGEQILTLSYLFEVEDTGIHNFSIDIAMSGGDLS